MWWPPCWTEVRHLFSTVSVAKLRAYERDSFSGACNAKHAYLSFRELSLPETGFPRMSLLGFSANKGSGGAYVVLKALIRSLISSRVLSVGIVSPRGLEPYGKCGTLAKEALVLSVESSISLSQSQCENATN